MLVGAGGFASTAGLVSAAAPRDTLVIGVSTDPRTLSPLSASTFVYWVSGYRLYSSLFQSDENFKAAPELAESWKVSPDQLTWTFRLKRATFHDGNPVTAEDVAFSVKEISLVHLSVCKRGLGSVIKGIETPDARTVVFRLSQPYPEMLNPFDGLGPLCSATVQKKLYAGTDLFTNPYNSKPIGSGPFKFVEWKKGSHVTLERNEKFYDRAPAIKRIVLRILPDPQARALAFEKGEVDWIPFDTPATEVARLSRLPGNRVFFHGSPCGTVDALGFNTRKELFANRIVRKALTAAINSEKIVRLAYFGGAQTVTGHVARTQFTGDWHNPKAKQMEYAPQRAGRMLDEAGYPVKGDGWRFQITLKHAAAYAQHIKEAELIKDDLKRVNVDLKIVTLDDAAWQDHVFKNWDFDTAILPFCTGPTPPSLKRYHSANIQRVPWTNAPGFSNAEYDRLFDSMMTETNREKRLRQIYRMQEILAEEQPSAFVVAPQSATSVKVGLFTEEPKNVWTLGYLWMHLNRIRPVQR
ncbi:MAG: hypothetical protein HY660_14335 [Armatimonadetes bacterium]|nr:hypothetical protein [Armatimonadota bacterium]